MNALANDEQLLQTPVGELAQSSSAELFHLRGSVAARIAKDKAIQSHIDAAIDFRLGDRVNRLRLELGGHAILEVSVDILFREFAADGAPLLQLHQQAKRSFHSGAPM